MSCSCLNIIEVVLEANGVLIQKQRLCQQCGNIEVIDGPATAPEHVLKGLAKQP